MKPNVIVVGSGAAGLAAALSAARNGRRVTVYEATATLGGTTALSAGVAWLPNNHRAREIGFDDSAADALEYLRGFSYGYVDDSLLRAFVEEAPSTARRLEEGGPLRWQPIAYPDYHAGRPGSRDGGRSMEVEPIDVDTELDRVLRQPVSWGLRATHNERVRGLIDLSVVKDREARGVHTQGAALVAALVMAAQSAGVTFVTERRIRNLVVERAQVVGVETPNGEDRGPVILATGGFERDPALAKAFLRAPATGLIGAPGARGDGLRMAQQMGARLGNMSEAWWAPAIRVPGDSIDGEPLWRFLIPERSRPGSIMVDQRGRRFMNEAQNYNDVGRAMQNFDPGDFRFDRDPSWLVFDEDFRKSYSVGPVLPGGPTPDWWTSATTPEKLASAIGVPEQAFASTIEHFNADASAGVDSEFGRGERTYDRFMGDPNSPHPNLRPLLSPPFHAVKVRIGVLATKGGAVTDAFGRVLHSSGQIIPGLYAAGSASANPFGLAYPGAGGAIGSALVFGDRAGTASASD